MHTEFTRDFTEYSFAKDALGEAVQIIRGGWQEINAMKVVGRVGTMPIYERLGCRYLDTGDTVYAQWQKEYKEAVGEQNR